MQDASLAEALLRDTTFTESFDVTRVVAISRNGTYWAAGSMRGKAWVWQEGGKLLHLAWQAHTDTVAALAFSPDGRTVATGSWDGALKLWDMERGPCSGRACKTTTSTASPLPPMDARSPAAQMMRSSSFGTPTVARTARRSPVRAALCTRWPGVPMGAGSPVGASMQRTEARVASFA